MGLHLRMRHLMKRGAPRRPLLRTILRPISMRAASPSLSMQPQHIHADQRIGPIRIEVDLAALVPERVTLQVPPKHRVVDAIAIAV